jgi:hypothetical protein
MADYTLNGVPNPGTYDAVGSSLATSGANDGGLVVTTSWGSIKAEYR